ncbi:MAG: dihydrofolate reductase [Xanthobacteraceae bacterium]|nr:dihydrofolate reductase [Xanthobacteraceae bacterium]
MALPDRIEGLAIVSADGMIADAQGVQPASLRLEADQQYFRRHLDRAAALVHGRHSGEGSPDAALRRRLILTRQIAGLAPDPQNPRALHWNPASASLEEAWNALGLSGGMLAVIGGTEPFGVFLERYDAFHLTCATRARLPGGRPVFPGIPPATPESLLAQSGLRPEPMRDLDAAAGLTLTLWRR